jgi:hypothetical protein
VAQAVILFELSQFQSFLEGLKGLAEFFFSVGHGMIFYCNVQYRKLGLNPPGKR